jgi:hypothetical protein
MALLLDARDIAVMALRKIGRVSPNQPSAKAADLSIALDVLDVEVAQLAGTKRLWWLVPANATFYLDANEASFDLITQSGGAITSVQFIITFQILDTNNRVVSVPRRISRREYDQITDKTKTGLPEVVYIDRTSPRPVVYTWPVTPAASTYQAYVAVQNYSETMSDDNGNTAHGLPTPWQGWAISRTAYMLGGGYISTLPSDELTRHKNDAQDALQMLQAFFDVNKQYGRRTKAWSF